MKIVTDCAADMSAEELEQLDVTQAPLFIQFPEGRSTLWKLQPMISITDWKPCARPSQQRRSHPAGSLPSYIERSPERKEYSFRPYFIRLERHDQFGAGRRGTSEAGSQRQLLGYTYPLRRRTFSGDGGRTCIQGKLGDAVHP